MINIDVQPITTAVAKHPKAKRTIAALAESSVDTIDKMLAGESNLTLSAMNRVAEFFGYDIEVKFRKQKEAAV